MKLRFASNTLRLRLRKSDIEQLRRTGAVRDAICFAEGNDLEYALKIEDVPFIHAQYTPGSILVRVPTALALAWMDSEQVSLHKDQPLYNGFHLSILIEKDFPCRHTITEEWSDTFFELAPEEHKPEL